MQQFTQKNDTCHGLLTDIQKTYCFIKYTTSDFTFVRVIPLQQLWCHHNNVLSNFIYSWIEKSSLLI